MPQKAAHRLRSTTSSSISITSISRKISSKACSNSPKTSWTISTPASMSSPFSTARSNSPIGTEETRRKARLSQYHSPSRKWLPSRPAKLMILPLCYCREISDWMPWQSSIINLSKPSKHSRKRQWPALMQFSEDWEDKRTRASS